MTPNLPPLPAAAAAAAAASAPAGKPRALTASACPLPLLLLESGRMQSVIQMEHVGKCESQRIDMLIAEW
jgi:hypothetical protein